MPGPFEFHNSLSAVDRGPGGDAECPELTRQHPPVDLDIIDDQDPELRQRLWKRSAADCRAGGGSQRDLKREPAALAEAAFDTNLAAHQLEQLFRDGKTKPCAAEPARDRPVSLAEFSEQLLLHLRRHADAGIGHREPHPREPAAARRTHPDLDGNAALVGEFDGIADEVEEDLAQPGRIAAKPGPGGRLDQDTKFDAFLVRFRPEKADCGFDRIDEVEVDRLELDLASLELR